MTPVQRYGEEVEDGGRAAEHVAWGPDVAQQRAQDPGGTYLQHSVLQCQRWSDDFVKAVIFVVLWCEA